MMRIYYRYLMGDIDAWFIEQYSKTLFVAIADDPRRLSLAAASDVVSSQFIASQKGIHKIFKEIFSGKTILR